MAKVQQTKEAQEKYQKSVTVKLTATAVGKGKPYYGQEVGTEKQVTPIVAERGLALGYFEGDTPKGKK